MIICLDETNDLGLAGIQVKLTSRKSFSITKVIPIHPEGV